jgi:hypothetical protein
MAPGCALPSKRAAIDAIAHQIAVALLDDIAEVNADPKLNSALGRHAGVAFDHRVLNFDGAAHRVDDAAELDESAVASALDHAPPVDGDSRVDQIAAQRPKPSERTIFVRARQPAEAHDIGGRDRRDFSVLAHAPLELPYLAQEWSKSGLLAIGNASN